jgi:PPOX class probable F420-dependent enzyme
VVSVTHIGKLPSWARALLESGRVARLGFLDDGGHPRVLPLTYALVGDRIWSAIDQKPKRSPAAELARVRFLRREPRAALTVDRYSDDWERLAWVQVLGEIEIVAADEAAGALEALNGKYPQYSQAPPPGPLLSLAAERCLFWSASESDESGGGPESE